MSRFKPVELPAGRELNGRVSQTMLRHFNGCPRSAFLYQRFKGDAQNVAMVRGTALHEALERATNAALDAGEKQIPADVAKAIMDEVLSEHHVPLEEHDYLRESVARWAAEWQFGQVVAVERLFVLDVLGVEVRAKVDYAEMRGRVLYVGDYKSSRGAPSMEDVARVRPEDGTFAAKNFQLVLYALAVTQGVPVEVVRTADGSYREERDESALIRGVDRVEAEFVYPGVEDSEGRMLRRGASVSVLELDEYRASLAGLVGRVVRAEESGDWPAQVSDGACGMCPAVSECPIPVEVRDHAGVINSAAEAADALEVLDRRRAQDRALRAEVKAFVKHVPGQRVRFGANKAAEFVSTTRTVVDRDGLLAAADAAAAYGTPYRREEFVRVRPATEFRDVTLSEDELAAERNDKQAAA